MKYKGIILSLLLLAGAFGTTFLAPARVHADTAVLNIPQSSSSNNIFGAGEGGVPTATTIRGAAAVGTNIPGANFTFDASKGTGTGGSGALIFRTAPAGSTGTTSNTLTEIMRITPAGNVGIGTTTPYASLHVKTAGTSLPTYTNGVASQDGIFFNAVNQGAGSNYLGTADIGAVIGTTDAVNGGSQLRFLTQPRAASAVPQVRMLIDKDGNVGIGTTGPTEKLVVGEDLGNIGTGTHIAVGDSSANVPGIGIGFNNTNRVALSWSGGENGFFSLGTSTTAGGGLWAKFVLKDGNVGIGTTSPLTTLDVAGSASMSGTLTVGNGGTIRPQYGPLTLAYKSALNSWTTGITLQDTTGNVGIGTTGPGYLLDVAGGVNLTGGLGVGTANPATDRMINAANTYTGDATRYGIVSIPTISDATLTANRTYYGIYNTLISNENTISSYAQTLNGLYSLARYSGTATAAVARGVYGYGYNSSTGTITSAYGIYGLVNNVDASGTITNAYGLYADVNQSAGTVTTGYGVYIGDVAGTTQYGLYQAGSTDTNYFAGNVGIGTTGPGGKLVVSQATNDAIILRLSSSSDTNGFDFTRSSTTGALSIQGNQTGSNNIVLAPTSGNVGIGTTSPTNELSFSGEANRGIWMERELTAGTVGRSLTVQAGGAVSGGSDLAGGNLLLSGGISTGSGGSIVLLRVFGQYLHGGGAGSGGASDNTAMTALTINDETELVLYSSTASIFGLLNVADAANACDAATGGTAEGYCIDINNNGESEFKLMASGNMTLQGTSNASGDPDYAELIPVENPGQTEAGDILVVKDGQYTLSDRSQGFNDVLAAKSGVPYQSGLIGVVSDNPGYLIDPNGAMSHEGGTVYENYKPLSVAGRVFVKVSSVNGPIRPGDAITSSEIPGVGMKATKAGQVVAKALQAYENPDPAGVGKILALVNVSWYDPDVYLTDTGDLEIYGSNGNYSLKNTVANTLVKRIGAFAEVAVANVRAGLIETKKLVVDGVDIAKKLTELSRKVESQQKQIEELKITVEELKNR